MKKSGMVIHLLVWLALVVVSIFLIGGSSMPHGWQLTANIGMWIAYFYINYLVLIPRLMMKGKTVAYILSALLLSAAAFAALKNSDIYFIRKNLDEQRAVLEKYGDVRLSYDEKTFEMQRRQRRAGERPPGPEQRYPAPDLQAVAQDTIIFTPREEEYGMLARETGFNRRRLREMVNNNDNYNPLHVYNYEYSFVIVVLYLMSLVLAFVRKSMNEEQKRSELEGEKTAAELAYLKQQINPHFLFNTLNAIYSYTLSVSEPASEAVLKLSSILRYMLYETNREKVPLASEIAVVDDYIDLQKLRMTDKTRINITMNGRPEGLQIEPMLLIPILENAFKYGVDSFRESFIDIGFEIEGHRFVFTVYNRIVRRNDSGNKSSGIGIRNIRRRLDLTYGDNYELTTGELDGVFSVTLRLNLR